VREEDAKAAFVARRWATMRAILSCSLAKKGKEGRQEERKDGYLG
jgi:hypothetical protein